MNDCKRRFYLNEKLHKWNSKDGGNTSKYTINSQENIPLKEKFLMALERI